MILSLNPSFSPVKNILDNEALLVRCVIAWAVSYGLTGLAIVMFSVAIKAGFLPFTVEEFKYTALAALGVISLIGLYLIFSVIYGLVRR